MKKYIWLLAIALLVIPLLLAACGGSATPAPAPAPAPAPTPTLAPAPTPTPAPTPAPTTAPAPAPTTVSTTPVIPHTLEGRSDCLLCHQTGVGEAPKVPADHAGRGNDLCQACHKTA